MEGERFVYNAATLRRGLAEFEQFFRMSSDEFYARHKADDELPVPRFERHVWASFYEDVQRLEADDAVMDRVSRTFAALA